MSTREANQRLINEAYAHVNTVGKPSVNEDGHCVYSGIGCGFSPAVLDEHKTNNHSNAKFLITYRPECLKKWARDCCPIIAVRVQCCHDAHYRSADFLKLHNRDLKKLCREHNYTYPGDKEPD